MALNNRRRRRGSKRRHLSLGMADPPIEIAKAAYVEASDNNRRSLVGRVLSPRKQDLYSVMETLPEKWRVSDSKLQGRIIGGGKFQFVFEDERDLRYVLEGGPWTYNGWLVVMQKWEDEPDREFLQWIPILVRIHGIPIRYLCKRTIREIASSLGEVIVAGSGLGRPIVDLRYSRVLVDIRVDTRLRFKKMVRFESGETAIVSFRYEDMDGNTLSFKYCRKCGALDHLTESCSHVWVNDDEDDEVYEDESESESESDDDDDGDGGGGSGSDGDGVYEDDADDGEDDGDGYGVDDDDNGYDNGDDDGDSLPPPLPDSSSSVSLGSIHSNGEGGSKRKFDKTL